MNTSNVFQRFIPERLIYINEYNQLFRFKETKLKVNQINVAQIVTTNKIQ